MGPTRKRKVHRKSRLGCRNCKLRRVKCDEKKPACRQCLNFNVVCNYDPSIPELQPRPGGANIGCIDTAMERSAVSANSFSLKMINASLRDDTSLPLLPPGYESKQLLDYSDMERMNRFQTRTVLTIGTKSTHPYLTKELVQLACSHRFLMHLVHSITAAHDRFLSGMALSKPTPTELYHMNQGVRAIQYKLSHPVRDQDRDAIFVSASLLGVLAFSVMDVSSVEEVWPLADDGDFGWLNISDGKKAVWQVVSPLRPDSVWQPLGELYKQRRFPEHKVPPERRPTVFDHLCCDEADGDDDGDDDGSPPSINPYRDTVRLLADLLDAECDDSTWTKFLGFIAHVDPYYKAMLQVKDPWAMLMLLYWFVKICRGPWWISTRAIIQGQAISLYLERYHADDTRLQEALKAPRNELDIARREGWGGPLGFGWLPAVSD